MVVSVGSAHLLRGPGRRYIFAKRICVEKCAGDRLLWELGIIFGALIGLFTDALPGIDYDYSPPHNIAEARTEIGSLLRNRFP